MLGEFGPIYEREEYNPDFKVQNDERYDMLERQLAIYSAESIGQSHLTPEICALVNSRSLVHLVIQGHQRHGHDIPEA